MADELDDLPASPTAKKPEPKPTPAPRHEPKEEEDDDEPVQKTYRHTPGMVQLALHFGYSQADIDGTTPADLRSELQLLQTEVGRQNKPKPEPEKKPAAEPVDEDEAYLAELEADENVDKKHLKFLRRQHEKLKAAEKKAARVDEFEENEKTRFIKRSNESAEAAISALGKKFAAKVGTGEWDDLTDPGHKGWRQEIFKIANVDFKKDSQATINRKVKAAAEKLSGEKIEEEEEDDETQAGAYGIDKPKKKAPPKDPATGRFTEEDFDRAKISKPSVKKIAAGEMTAVEATRNLLRQNGDPRGFRTPVEFDDDLPEG